MERPNPRAWALTLAALALFAAGHFVPLPCLDESAIPDQAFASSTDSALLKLFGLHPPRFPVLSLGLYALVIIRGAMALLTPAGSQPPPRLRRMGFTVYLVAVILQGGALEQRFGRLARDSFPELLPRPAPLSSVLIVLTITAGAALLWELASWITRSGVGHGPLVLMGAQTLSHSVNAVAFLFHLVSPPHVALLLAATLLPLTTIGATLWRWRPTGWPLPAFRGLNLLSPVDCLALPYLVGRIISTSNLKMFSWLAPGLARTHYEALWYWSALPPLLIAVGLAAWLRSHRTEPGPRGWGLLALVTLVLALVPALLTAGAALYEAKLSIDHPAALPAYEVVLRSEDGHGAHDAKRITDRLSELRCKVDRVDAHEHEITLRIRTLMDPNALLDLVLPRHQLELQFVAADQSPVRPGTGPRIQGLDVRSDTDGAALYVASSAEELRPLLDRVTPPAGQVVRIDCQSNVSRARACSPWLLEEEPIVSGGDVKEAWAARDRRYAPQLELAFTRSASTRLADATGSHLGRGLAIVLDGRILAHPVIKERIPNGRAIVTLGRDDKSEDARLEELQYLARALELGGLEGTWERASVTRR